MSNNENPEKGAVAKSHIALTEEKILSFWNEKGIFIKTLEKTKKGEPFVFFDGPPFATGLPHYGHILAGTMKDIIPRYQTMRGKYVARRWGWDCHGLPIENLVEKQIGVSNKKDIEAFGIEKFNSLARNNVLTFDHEWKRIVPRCGRFIDMDNPYMSMQPTFTESVWWGFSELYKKSLAYEGFKSMHLCPRCETTLSNFEVNQGYKDITDISVYALFECADEKGTYFLAWTTTPWTLPGNVALAVGADVAYVKIQTGERRIILAKERLEKITEEYQVLEEIKGSDLVGISYTPIFSYFVDTVENKENGWKVYAADFVTTEDGTGIVHIAPAFGDDDYNLGRQHALPFVQHVTPHGVMVDAVTDFKGLFVKPKEDHQATDIQIIKYLAHSGALYAKEKIIHSYPHCYRCDTPLINYATSSWFIKVPDMRDALIEQNKTVKWIPETIGEGRFGNWLEGAKDWSISRSRFWGTPLPIWKSKEGTIEVLGSVQDIKSKTQSNTFTVMRHGESDHNINRILSSDNTVESHLTEQGKRDVIASAKELKERGPIDYIFVSPLIRTQETAALVAQELSISTEMIITDDRITEVQGGDLNGKSVDEYRSYFSSLREKFDRPTPGEKGETAQEMKNRLGDFLYDINSQYKDKHILIVTHEYGAWLLDTIARGLDKDQSVAIKDMKEDYLDAGKWMSLDFAPLPHNRDYELDMHRPYIDEISWINERGEEMRRIPDVFDTWVDSGSMSFAQHHFPFSNKFEGKTLEEKKKSFVGTYYPADFIAEGIDQTRGWFYTLLVMGVAHFDVSPYKNVIVNGLVLAEDGRKMSKSLNNYPPVEHVLDKYGADAMRYYMVSSPIVRAEDLNFSERGVDEVMKKIVMRFYNVLSFYEMYGGNAKAGMIKAHSHNILDAWMTSRIHETRNVITKALDGYELDRASRPFLDLVDDLSTWYLRRSRDRFKEEGKDMVEALQTTRYALVETAILFAPFMPFMAEEVYQRVKTDGMPESVHLCDWPESREVDSIILDNMKILRDVVSEALEVRSQSKIKVRQPLQSVTVASELVANNSALADILKDELNVKEVYYNASLEKSVLDTTITPTLKDEGYARELMRAIQNARKEAGLEPHDRITLSIQGSELPSFIVAHKEEIMQTVGAQDIVARIDCEGESLSIEEMTIVFSIV